MPRKLVKCPDPKFITVQPIRKAHVDDSPILYHGRTAGQNVLGRYPDGSPKPLRIVRKGQPTEYRQTGPKRKATAEQIAALAERFNK